MIFVRHQDILQGWFSDSKIIHILSRSFTKIALISVTERNPMTESGGLFQPPFSNPKICSCGCREAWDFEFQSFFVAGKVHKFMEFFSESKSRSWSRNCV